MHVRDAVKAPYHVGGALALTWVAGFVDVVGYMVLYRVFVANMTGNTIALGQGLTAGDWESCCGGAWPFRCSCWGSW
jgi:uncharacterized membrane protein YoaK (UPF0700 family)